MSEFEKNQLLKRIEQLEKEVENKNSIIDELSHSEERYKRFSDTILDLMVVFDNQGNAKYLNTSAKKYFGFDSDYYNNESIFNYIHKDDVKLVKDGFNLKLLGDYSNRLIQVRLKDKFGNYNVFEINTAVIIIKNRVDSFISICRDISEMKHREQELINAIEKAEESERQQKLLLENSLYPISITSSQGKIIFVNKAARKLFNFDDITEIENHIASSFWKSPEKRSEFLQEIQKSGQIIDFENVYLTFDKEEITVLVTANFINYMNETVIFAIYKDITQTKKLENEIFISRQKLEESELAFRSLVENAPMGIYRTTKEGNITLCNDSIAKMLGFNNSQDLINNHSASRGYFKDEERENFISKIEKEGKLIGYDTIWKKNDGTILDIRETARCVTDEHGNTLYFEGMVEDFTDKKKAEIELLLAKEKAEESDKFNQSIAHLAPDIIYIYDISLAENIYINKDFGEILGFEKGKYLNNSLELIRRQIVNDDHNEFYVDEEIKKWDDEFSHNFTYRIIDANNNIRWYYGREKSFKKENNEVTQLIGIITEITKQKEIEIELIKAKDAADAHSANVTAIIEGTIDSIWAFDQNYNILYINQTFQSEFLQSFGVRLEPGISLIDSLPDFLRPFWKPRYDRVLNNEQFTVEDAIETNLGTVYIQVTFNPIVKNGEVVGGSCFGSNITLRKLAEFELIKAKEKAEESDKLKTAFLQNISHEIRTPLNGILGFSELLKQDDLHLSEIQEFIYHIQKSSNRLLDTIDKIMTISMIETDQIKLDKFSFDINNLMSDLFLKHNEYALSKNIILINDKKEVPYLIENDIHKISSILSNLIENSIKFTEKGYVQFGYKPTKNKITFFVKDSGLGIASEKKDLLFQKFTQADTSISRGYEGLGLGLAICKNLSTFLRGRIWFEMNKVAGTTFYFELPITK